LAYFRLARDSHPGFSFEKALEYFQRSAVVGSAMALRNLLYVYTNHLTTRRKEADEWVHYSIQLEREYSYMLVEEDIQNLVIGRFYYYKRVQQYELALVEYGRVEDPNLETVLDAGYCHERLGHLSIALDHYERAGAGGCPTALTNIAFLTRTNDRKRSKRYQDLAVREIE